MPRYRNRLTHSQQRIYDRSDAISSIRIQASARLQQAVECAAQAIADEICLSLAVGRARVRVSGTRPSNTRGELHGLYTAGEGSGPTTIKVWMLTAKRGQVVAFKTFMRTLLHEICHHLDYAHLHLNDSFHTDGFYKRESSLFYQIGAAEIAPPRRRAASDLPPPSSGA
jgi:hypothetical protein